jgi:hypothetical protein
MVEGHMAWNKGKANHPFTEVTSSCVTFVSTKALNPLAHSEHNLKSTPWWSCILRYTTPALEINAVRDSSGLYISSARCFANRITLWLCFLKQLYNMLEFPSDSLQRTESILEKSQSDPQMVEGDQAARYQRGLFLCKVSRNDYAKNLKKMATMKLICTTNDLRSLKPSNTHNNLILLCYFSIT